MLDTLNYINHKFCWTTAANMQRKNYICVFRNERERKSEIKLERPCVVYVNSPNFFIYYTNLSYFSQCVYLEGSIERLECSYPNYRPNVSSKQNICSRSNNINIDHGFPLRSLP